MQINKYNTKTNQLVESIVFVDGKDVYYELEEKTEVKPSLVWHKL